MSSSARSLVIGLVLPFAFGIPLAAMGLQYVPDIDPLGTFARIFEHTAPQLFAAGLIPAALLTVLRARWLAALSLTLTLTGAGLLITEQVRNSAPLAKGARADLQVIWFNALFENPEPPERIADAIRTTRADVVILSEAWQLGQMVEGLRDLYPHQLGCARTCEVVMLSQHPLQPRTVRNLGPVWNERLILTDLDVPGAPAPVTLAALHMIKPWYYGITEPETEAAIHWLAPLETPLIIAGDFNAAPWSDRMRALRTGIGMVGPHRPVATWPASAGAFGVPIDHVLVKNGPRIVSIGPWGEGLGSDHRGLIATLALPDAPLD